MTQAAEYPKWMQQRIEADSDVLELAPDEAEAFSLFLSLGTQWNRHPLTGARIGIDYAAIHPTADMLQIETSPAMLLDLRIMEDEALSEFGKVRR